MTFIILCPHCEQHIEILETNCCIFRCGIFKDTFTQINPHLHKQECDDLIKNAKIFGCGKPFQLIINNNNVYTPIICDYV